MVSNKLFLVCLVLVSSVTAAPSQKDSKAEDEPADLSHVDFSGEIPTVVIHIKDADNIEHEFRAPYFDPQEEPLPEEIRAFARDVITKTMKPAKQIIDGALIKGKNKFFLSPILGSIAIKFFFMAMGFMNKSKELKMKYEQADDDEFQDDAIKFLPKLIKEAKQQMKDADDAAKASGIADKKESSKKYKNSEAREKTGRRIMLIFDGIKEIVLNSPVGTHLDYQSIIIDGKLMSEEAVEHLKFMSKSGLGWVIDLIGRQVENISAEQEKEAAAEKAPEDGAAAPTNEAASTKSKREQ